MTTNTVIVSGNPMDGIIITGPFNDFDEAINYATSNISNEQWWTSKLEPPYTNSHFNSNLEVSPF